MCNLNLKVIGSYRQICYHINFHTYRNESVLNYNENDELYRYITGIIKNKRCKPLQINGIDNHVHIVCDLHPSVALADLIKDIKVASSLWIKENGLYPKFRNWSGSYGAFTYSVKSQDRIIRYVQNQQELHKKESAEDEFIRLLREHNIDFDSRYLF